ncbi:MAG: sensor histidine kinase, partial [Gammaproteobacteria bacterium]
TFYEFSELEQRADDIPQCQLLEDGLQMLVPAPEQGIHYLLHSPDSKLLFSQKDIQLLSSLLKVSRQFISIQQALDQGAEDERQRIARDLHDDVAARLLTLIHKLHDQDSIELARSILKSLRNSIYTLDSRSTTTISHALTDIRAEIQERFNSVGIFIDWHQPNTFDGCVFTPRQHINLQRIFHEITTNIIRHAQADFIHVDIIRNDKHIHIMACDNGLGFDINECIPGKGINNIQTRVKELNGEVEWKPAAESGINGNRGCCIDICFPLAITAE